MSVLGACTLYSELYTVPRVPLSIVNAELYHNETFCLLALLRYMAPLPCTCIVISQSCMLFVLRLQTTTYALATQLTAGRHKCDEHLMLLLHTLLEKIRWILLYVTDDATAKLNVTYSVKLRQIEGNG